MSTVTMTVTHDYLSEGEPDTELGRTWSLSCDELSNAPMAHLRANVFDDDGIRYYTVRIEGPADLIEEEDVLYECFLILQRNAGTTDMRFIGRKDLDMG